MESKNSGGQLSEDRKKITFTDKKNIGTVKLKGTRDLNFYPIDQIKRVRIVKRADDLNQTTTKRLERGMLESIEE